MIRGRAARLGLLLAGASVLGGCALLQPAGAPAVPGRPAPSAAGAPGTAGAAGGCAAVPVQLLEPAPLFTGPQAQAALDRGLAEGQRLQLCAVQGQRQQVLLPRPGLSCSGPAACASGWIPRSARTGPAP